MIHRITTRKSDVWLRDGWPDRFTMFPRWAAFWRKVGR